VYNEITVKVILELCVESFEESVFSINLGANRLELCSQVDAKDGLTPPIELLEKVYRHIQDNEKNTKIAAMNRVRQGGFSYDKHEYTLMLEDNKKMLSRGANDIVFGFLEGSYGDRGAFKIGGNNRIAVNQTKDFVENIKSIDPKTNAVFHRAFDCITPSSIDDSVNALIDCGVDRILTSGLKQTAIEGKKTIKYLQETYGDKIQILAGAGVNRSNKDELIDYTKVKQIHSRRIIKEEFVQIK
jgi:copper homeostasis protein